MAELHHIVGSILRDISRARASSDIYSRNLSKYYEQDPLLRRFPTPRSEIDEVEIDLRFVISGIEVNPSQDEDRESMAATIYVKYSDYITQAFFDGILNSLDKLGKERKISEIDSETLEKIRGFEHRIYLKQDVLLYFQRHRERLREKIDDGSAQKDIKGEILSRRFERIDRDKASEERLELAKALLFQDSILSGNDLKIIEESVFRDSVDKALKKLLKEMLKPLRYAWADEGDKKITVEVTADKLRETPEAVISSIKIKTRVQNYVWTKVEHEGKKWRALNPE